MKRIAKPTAPDFSDTIRDLIEVEKKKGTSTGKTCQEWADEWGCGYNKARKLVALMLGTSKMVREVDRRETLLRPGVYPVSVFRVL